MENESLNKKTKVKIAIISSVLAALIVAVLLFIFLGKKGDKEDANWNRSKAEYKKMNAQELYDAIEEGMPSCKEEAIYEFDLLLSKRDELIDYYIQKENCRRIEAEEIVDETLVYIEQSKAMLEAMNDELYNTQLTKYVNKSNVSSDMMLCDNIQVAIISVLCDPDVIAEKSYINPYDIYGDSPVSLDELLNAESDIFEQIFLETMGMANLNELKDRLKTSTSKMIYLRFKNNNTLVVYLPGTDMSGEGKDNQLPDTIDNRNSCIYRGPVEYFEW